MQELTKVEKQVFKRLSSPEKIQDFLDSIPFNFEKNGGTLMSPRRVLVDKKAHCIEGALFAAAALAYHGQEPLLMDLSVARGDYDHVVALFRKGGYWGAISKTNHAVLRYRDAVYRTPRELAMSYFHEYFLPDTGRKTLLSYSRPFSLRRFGTDWFTTQEDLWDIGAALDDTRHFRVVPKDARLRHASKLERRASSIPEYT